MIITIASFSHGVRVRKLEITTVYSKKVDKCYSFFSSFVFYQTDIEVRISKIDQMSRVIRKPTFCICENKGADQLCSNGDCAADQCLCFRYIDSTTLYFLNLKFQASWHLLHWLYSPVCVRPGRNPEDRFFHNVAQII